MTVVRGPFYFPPVSSRMLADDIGYLRIDSFVQSGVQLPDGTEALSEKPTANWTRSIPPARRRWSSTCGGNGGGDVYTATEVLECFLPEDTVSVIRFDRRGHESTGIVSGKMRLKRCRWSCSSTPPRRRRRGGGLDVERGAGGRCWSGARRPVALATSVSLPWRRPDCKWRWPSS
ncbi:MAG: hypothetical protein U0531_18115 [Dehalococcoidia bacterium]